VDPLMEALSALWRESGTGDELRLIGGLAVRLHVGANARQTADIDVVALRTGLIAELYEQTLSRAPEEQELQKLEQFLSALERSGL